MSAMTNERHLNLSNSGKRSEELPMMRRSRSLSELPGHLRVPILQRKDSERTKARLEAGAAGVKELRALREQQQELIDQAMATAQPKWKQQTVPRRVQSLTDHHRIQQHHKLEHQRQQINNSFSAPLSTWHSACSLASISEEWDHTLNISANRNTQGSSLNDHYKTKIINSRNGYQKQNECTQSENIYRGRSQSIHGDFLYVPGANGNESKQSVSSQSTLNNRMCNDNKSSHDDNRSLGRNMHVKGMKCKAHSLDLNDGAYTSMNMQEQKNYQIPLSCPAGFRVKSQSMSWDNLLAIIGLQNENSTTTNESMEQDIENCDDVFTDDNAVSRENTRYPARSDDEYLQAVQRKKMRSQSFTSGYSMHQDSNYNRLLTTKDLPPGNQGRYNNVRSNENVIEENVQPETVQEHLFEHQKQTTEKTNSISLLRRASIQCEAVLTQTSAPRKILNPLQDVDINSLRSPGPLHAVTLQYSSMPMRELSDSRAQIASSTNSVPGKKLTPSNTQLLDAEVLNSSPSTNVSSRHSPIAEHGCNFVSMSNSKQFKSQNSRITVSESSLSEQNTSNEHPVPKPRTSILQGLSTQEAKSQYNCNMSGTNRKQNMTPEFLQKSTAHETNNSNHTESDRNNQDGSFTLTVFNSVVETEQNCSKLESDNTNKKIKKEYARENNTTQKDVSVRIKCSSVEKTTPDFKVDTVNRRNVSSNKSSSLTAIHQKPLAVENVTEGASQIQSNTAKKHNHGGYSKLFLSSKKQSLHSQDVSMISDEGYSTCDSTNSPKSHVASVGSLQFFDMSSLSSASLASISGSLNYSERHKAGLQKLLHTPSSIESYVKCERHLKNSSDNSNKEINKTKGITGTNKGAADKSQAYTEQCKTAEPKLVLCKNPEDNTAAPYHSYHSLGELAQHTTNQQTSTKDGLALCNNNIQNNSNSDTVAMTEMCNKLFEEVMPTLAQSNNPVEETGRAVTKNFKQTSV